MLYANETNIQHSSIKRWKGFFSVQHKSHWKRSCYYYLLWQCYHKLASLHTIYAFKVFVFHFHENTTPETRKMRCMLIRINFRNVHRILEEWWFEKETSVDFEWTFRTRTEINSNTAQLVWNVGFKYYRILKTATENCFILMRTSWFVFFNF